MQNLSLLKLLGIEIVPQHPRLVYGLSEVDHVAASEYLNSCGVVQGCYLVGVHAGAGPLGERKKWGIINFANEINSLTLCHDNHFVLLLGSEDEICEREALADLLTTKRVAIYTGPLATVAGIISRCSYFLSNDTGLMHIASVFGIHQKAVFVSTNPTRTRPFNDKAVVDIINDCSKYTYPFSSTRA
jgi:ADP-heptose:LPS heptosyltransferase